MLSEYYQTAGQVLRELRQKLGLTQEVLEGQLAWGTDTVRRVENGRQQFARRHLDDLIESDLLKRTPLPEESIWILRFEIAMEYEWERQHREQYYQSGITKHMRLRGLAECALQRHQISANVHDDYAVGLDDWLRTAFAELNDQRRERGLREYFASTCYRLIRPPEIRETEAILDVAPISFVYLALLLDPAVDSAVKAHAGDRLREVAARIPDSLQSDHPILNARNFHPLGTEILLVTNDDKMLLRRRSKDVVVYPSRWDVSAGGYCVEMDRIPNGELDLIYTVVHEVTEEIDVVSADPSRICFTGVYGTPETHAVDVLVLWPIEASTSQLVDLLTDKHPEIRKVFETSRRAKEPYVWDTRNMIVDYDGPALVEALKEIGRIEGNSHALLPGAYACLLRGLESAGRSTAGLKEFAPV